MNILENGAEVIIQLHGAKPLKTLLEKKPTDASMIALSRNKFASIFYKGDLGIYHADFGNGWELVSQGTITELVNDLNAISFILIDLNALEVELKQIIAIDENDLSIAKVLNGVVETQLARVEMRRTAEESEYWQGQSDAYEIVRNTIKPFL